MIVFNTTVEDRNFYYLSGIEEPCRGVVVHEGRPVVLASPLDEGIAREYVETQVFKTRKEFWKVLGEIVTEDRVGLNFSRMPVGTFRKLRKHVKAKFYDAGKEMAKKRLKKDKKEVEKLRRAAKIASRSMEEIRDFLRPGLSEFEVMSEIEHLASKKGSGRFAFETIVSSGPRTALPHSTASKRKLRPGDVVMVDFGPSYKMYASDMTRTFCLGGSDEFKERYRKVLDAQAAARAAAGDGADVRSVQQAAEKVIGKMAHLVGHGVGLDVHEDPRFSKGRLERGMVFTIEPALYDGFGVRIEDTFFLGKKLEPLTNAPRDLDFALI